MSLLLFKMSIAKLDSIYQEPKNPLYLLMPGGYHSLQPAMDKIINVIIG